MNSQATRYVTTAERRCSQVGGDAPRQEGFGEGGVTDRLVPLRVKGEEGKGDLPWTLPPMQYSFLGNQKREADNESFA